MKSDLFQTQRQLNGRTRKTRVVSFQLFYNNLDLRLSTLIQKMKILLRTIKKKDFRNDMKKRTQNLKYVCIIYLFKEDGWVQCMTSTPFFFLRFLFIYFQRGEGREEERETSMCGCLSSVPSQASGSQPRHVPRLGIKLATFWFAGWHSIH